MRRPQLSYANVMSTIAVFIALGGTSYAVARNSIGTRELKNNAVTSAKIKNGTVLEGDLAPGARSGPRGPRGPQGPPGSSAGSPAALAADLQPEAWKPLQLRAPWGNYPDADFGSAAYRKDKQGQVHLRGLVTKGGPADTPIRAETFADLPPGYRPAQRQIISVTTGNTETPGVIDISPDGAIRWLSGATNETDYTSISNIHFFAD